MQKFLDDNQLEEVILSNNTRFFYSTRSMELTNAIGAIVAVLKEYNFMPAENHLGEPVCKLYKTEEGNWYDMPAAPVTRASLVLWQLKSAIDQKEASL